MKKTVKRFLCIILVLTLALSGVPGVFSPVERVYAAGNGLYQVECTRPGQTYSFIIMHESPVLLSRILMGVGLKNKTVSVAPTFSPDPGFTVTYEKISNKDDWWLSYDGSLADSFECDMTVVSDATYTIHLKKLNKTDQPTTGVWKNKDSNPKMMRWTYLDGTLTLSPDNAGEEGTLSMYGEKDDFGLDKSAGTNSAMHAADWIPEVPWKFWINDITEVVIKTGVTSIGQQAFRRHINLESVKIEGDTLAKIGKCAFYDCSSLEMLDLRGCPSLTEIESSSTEGPFIGTKLKTILLSPALTTIPVKLFNLDGAKLTKVNLSDLVALESIEQEAFRRNYGSGALAITDYNGGNLNLNVQTKLTTIGKDAFRNQDGLDPHLMIASPVLTTIAEGAFSAYTAQYGVLESVDLSACASLETIGKEAFLNQKNLKSIVFPDAFTWVDKDAFKNCGLNLTAATIAYCVGGNGALYNVNADGTATRILNAGEDTLSWIPTAIATELSYTDAEQALVNGPTLCPETGSYSIAYTLNGSSVSGIPSAKDPGTYEVGYTVTLPDGATAKSGTVSVTIAQPAAITDSMLSLDRDSFEYDGNTHTPVLTVNDGTADLVKDTDYTVDTTSVTSAENVGSYTISVTGKGIYANTASVNWSIVDTKAPVISGVTNGTDYTAAVSFSVSDLLLDSVTLQRDSETPQALTVSSGSASDTVSENGSYEIVAADTSGNTTTLSFTVSIPKQITSAMLSLDQDSFEYDGSSHAPVLTVKDGTTELSKDTDYTISGDTSKTDAGSYTISVTGKGGYTGTASIPWTIVDTTAPAISGVTNGTEYTEAVSFSVSDLLLSTVTLQKDSEAQQDLTVSGGSASGTASENGTYTVVAKDTSGNTKTLSFTVAIPEPEPEPGTDPEPPAVLQAETPVFDPAGGKTFKEELKVTISCGTPGAAIYYTKDGSDPGAANGEIYTSGSAITLTRTTTLKAIAVADGYTDSGIAEASYRKRRVRDDEEEIPDDGPPLADPFPFKDVPEGTYYRKAVEWAWKKGVTGGTSAELFSPYAPATRAQAVTALWAAAGSPEPTLTANPFKDVSENDYFCKAVLWAYEQGITSGVSADEFGVDRNVSRAQFITFLYGAQGRPAAGSEPFDDVNASDYFQPSVAWAYEKGITSGTGEGRFSPDADCQRCQVVTFLYLTYGVE